MKTASEVINSVCLGLGDPFRAELEAAILAYGEQVREAAAQRLTDAADHLRSTGRGPKKRLCQADEHTFEVLQWMAAGIREMRIE